MQNKDKTHCAQGHEFTEENTKFLTNGHRRCIVCVKQWQKTADSKRKGRSRYNKHGKRQHLMYLYQLSQKDYDTLVASQHSKCKACGIFVDCNFNNTLQVDHNHYCCPTQKCCGKCIRGLLCGRCNRALGLVNDSVYHLESLIQYIKNSK